LPWVIRREWLPGDVASGADRLQLLFVW